MGASQYIHMGTGLEFQDTRCHSTFPNNEIDVYTNVVQGPMGEPTKVKFTKDNIQTMNIPLYYNSLVP